MPREVRPTDLRPRMTPLERSRKGQRRLQEKYTPEQRRAFLSGGGRKPDPTYAELLLKEGSALPGSRSNSTKGGRR